MRYLIIILILTITINSCSPGYEVVNTFKNLDYSGIRLFPVKTNYSEFTFRIWISNSTSIDRVISISKDSASDFQGSLVEFGKLYNGKNYKDYYKEIEIVPKVGFEIFKKMLDSLDLFDLKNKSSIDIVLHQPFSTYVIEIKDKTQFNTFRFDTYYPYNSESEDSYSEIRKLILEQFELKTFFKFKNNGS